MLTIMQPPETHVLCQCIKFQHSWAEHDWVSDY